MYVPTFYRPFTRRNLIFHSAEVLDDVNCEFKRAGLVNEFSEIVLTSIRNEPFVL